MKCSYCHNEGNKIARHLPKEKIFLLIENSYDLGLKQMRLTGGEPLLHPEIYEICKTLKEKYNLKIGINTNAIFIDKLLELINEKLVDRVVVGLDYFDAPISKDSPIGLSSEEIKENIIKIKNSGCNVSVSKVYTGDYEDTFKIVEWGINNQIRIKILEIENGEISDQSVYGYDEMQRRLIINFGFTLKKNSYQEATGWKGDYHAVSFFHSKCRIRKCDLCRKMHLRVTSEGKLKTCLHYCDDDLDFCVGDVRENILKKLNSPVNYYLKKT
jgi:cyclic pyranopterin phosphate synthase